ncbi:unnamed protein product [Paramecium sonneborni]|uniref:Transmembrane protein n=1 Tax=Paramecium sonneborni TaxID=65129 RepID=A0A8S1RLS5_9CILI|nr:unnamed protein product [Paramecium sonneborni]
MIRYYQQYHSFFAFATFSLLISSCNAINHLREHIQKYQNKHFRSTHQEEIPYVAFIFGFLVIFWAFITLWYNERRYSITWFRLEQTKKLCISINSAEVNPNTNNQLIHINGESKTNDQIVDAAFGLQMKDCIKLVRKVEMYQWVQKSRSNKRSGRTIYYVQEWSSFFHSECTDEHSNDQSKWIVEEETQTNLNVRLGAYLISKSLAEQTEAKESLIMFMNNQQAVANYFGQQKGFQNFEANGEYIYFQQNKGAVTLNDLRVSFNAARTGPTTIVSQQNNDSFTPFIIHDNFEQTLAGQQNLENVQISCLNFCCVCCKYCKAVDFTEINWIFESILTKDQVFQSCVQELEYITMIFRIIGNLLMGLGFCMIFSPIWWLISLFPLVGFFLASFSGFIFFLVSLIISIPFSLLIMGLAQLFYNPKQGIVFIALCCVIGAGIFFYIQSQS